MKFYFTIFLCILLLIVFIETKETVQTKLKLITNKYELINIRVGEKIIWREKYSNETYRENVPNLTKNQGLVNPVFSSGKEIGFHLHLHAFNDSLTLNVVYSSTFSKVVDHSALVVIYGKETLENKSLIENKMLSKFFVGSVIGRGDCRVTGDVRSRDFKKTRATISCPSDDLYLEAAVEDSIRYRNPDNVAFTSIFYRKSDVMEDVCPNSSGNTSQPCIFDAAKGIVTNVTIPSRRPFSRSRVMSQDYRGKVCGMHLIADHTFHRFFGRNEANVLREMLTNFQESDKIYRATDFNGDNHPDGIGLKIKRISIFKDDGHSYFNIEENVKSDAVLDALTHWAAYQGDYCLTLLFTNRDYDPERTIGLAWVGRPNYMNAGGLCDHTRRDPAKRSYTRMNTAMVTNINGGELLTTAINTITFAHEVGHNFGAEHDEGRCRSRNQADNYIMLPAANHPFSQKNKMFSPCSIAMMLPVIRNKGFCLEEDQGPRCGDTVLQAEFEQCDCGTTPEECQAIDPCCVPARSQSEKPCTLRRGAQCTPMRSSCCDPTCFLSGQGKPCLTSGNPCLKDNRCDGLSFECPQGSFAPDGTPCAGTSMICVQGKCDRTFCAFKGLRDCECVNPDTHVCAVCCINEYGHCIPADAIESLRGVSRMRSPGSSCHQGNGACTVEGRCGKTMGRILDAGTDFEDVDKAEDVGKAASWAVNNWFYFLIGGFLVAVGIVACLGLNFNRKRKKKVNELKEGVATAKTKVEKHPVGNKLSKSRKDQAARLANFFPTVSMDEIIEVSQKDLPEGEMIEELQGKGYRMKQDVFIDKVHKSKKPKDKGHSSGSKDKGHSSGSKDKGHSSGSKDKGHSSGSKDKGHSRGSKDKGHHSSGKKGHHKGGK